MEAAAAEGAEGADLGNTQVAKSGGEERLRELLEAAVLARTAADAELAAAQGRAEALSRQLRHCTSPIVAFPMRLCKPGQHGKSCNINLQTSSVKPMDCIGSNNFYIVLGIRFLP